MNPEIVIRDMREEDEEFVSTCTHVRETAERTAAGQVRLPYLREQQEHGHRTKVALADGKHVGFIFLMPIEISPWGPVGRDLMAIQCLTVEAEVHSLGVGRLLVEAAEEEARKQSKKGIAVTGYYHDFWFMPAAFFEKLGYELIERKGTWAFLWKVFDPSAEKPTFPERRYEYTPVEGKVVIDLFWSRCCLTTVVEAQRVREVAAEFEDEVVLNEYCSDFSAIREKYGITRGIFVNGEEIGWGYDAPKEGVREAIRKAQG